MNAAGTVALQVLLVLVVCWIGLEMACEAWREWEQRRAERFKLVLALIQNGFLRRAR